jgi:hypothetical protein
MTHNNFFRIHWCRLFLLFYTTLVLQRALKFFFFRKPHFACVCMHSKNLKKNLLASAKYVYGIEIVSYIRRDTNYIISGKAGTKLFELFCRHVFWIWPENSNYVITKRIIRIEERKEKMTLTIDIEEEVRFLRKYKIVCQLFGVF